MLCSGNGQYSKGTCQCYSGWKGAECDVPLNQCIDPSCGGHGSCIDGNCVCSAGYKGEHCEEGKPEGWAGVCRSGPMLRSLVLASCYAKGNRKARSGGAHCRHTLSSALSPRTVPPGDPSLLWPQSRDTSPGPQGLRGTGSAVLCLYLFLIVYFELIVYRSG